MNTRRSYTMGARAKAVEETRRRILQAAFDLARHLRVADISLSAVAEASGVSVQTVLRQFGSRDGMVEATFAFASAQVVAERRTPVGDVPAALRSVLDHYEQRGDTALLMLAQEDTDPVVREMTANGKAIHRTWVSDVFAPYVGTDESLIDLLVVATDVYAWKLLRRDRALSRDGTESRMRALVEAILATAKPATADQESPA